MPARRIECHDLAPAGRFCRTEIAKAPRRGKVIPNKNELAEAYQLFARGKEAAQIIERELAKLNGGSPVQVPADLRKRVRHYLAQHPAARWDEAVAASASSPSGARSSHRAPRGRAR